MRKVTPLIDGDLIRYETGFGGQMKNEHGEPVVREFDFVANLLDRRINMICESVEATEPPLIYLTSDTYTWKEYQKVTGTDEEIKPNFRESLAKTRPYKGTRKGDKPYHFKNITSHLIHNYNVKVANGIEADDLLAIDHTLSPTDTVICSRDKDLKMVPGKHFGWGVGQIPGFGYRTIDEVGFLNKPAKSKLTGGGFKFFCAQMLMGDSVDNIPGLPKSGPVAAYELLNELDSVTSLTEAVAEAYRKYFDRTEQEGWLEYFNEQASLLWICRELDSEGNPVIFQYENNNE